MAGHVKVGSRILVQKERGTIRYIGAITGTKGEWLGVEWDDPLRGKHDGNHQGTRYFECRSPTAGSFIRFHPDKVILGCTFLEALKEKYIDETINTGEYDASKDTGDLYFGGNPQIKVETVGFDKIRREQSDIGKLTTVGLEECAIAFAGDNDEISKANLHIQELDLASNLFNDWMTVADIVRQLPDLKSLRLGRNRLGPPPSSDMFQGTSSPFEKLTCMTLNSTLIDWDNVLVLATLLPRLEELQLAANHIRELTPCSGVFNRLTNLKLDDNQLDSWEMVTRLGSLPSLEILGLNDNMVRKIHPPETNMFTKLKVLRIKNNNLDDWSSFDALDKFPSLTLLQCDGNPVFRDSDVDFRLAQTIGRIANLKTVNGTMVVGRERDDYERYYLKLCTADGKTHADIAKLNPRYETLCRLHDRPVLGIDAINQGGPSTLNDRLIEITISNRTNLSEEVLMKANTTTELVHPVKQVQKRILGTMLIRNLRIVVQKLLKIPTSEQLFLIQYIESDRHLLCIKLDDDLRNLGYYGVSSGSEIAVIPSS